MFKGKFEEKDKEKVVEFLNFVAKKSVFKDMSTQDVISCFGLLNYMQKVILPKIDANIAEIIEVKEPVEEEENPEEIE